MFDRSGNQDGAILKYPYLAIKRLDFLEISIAMKLSGKSSLRWTLLYANWQIKRLDSSNIDSDEFSGNLQCASSSSLAF
jgi:hypothetical protein